MNPYSTICTTINEAICKLDQEIADTKDELEFSEACGSVLDGIIRNETLNDYQLIFRSLFSSVLGDKVIGELRENISHLEKRRNDLKILKEYCDSLLATH